MARHGWTRPKDDYVDAGFDIKSKIGGTRAVLNRTLHDVSYMTT